MKFERSVENYPGYYLKVDLRRDDFRREKLPHWHLYKNGHRLASILVDDPTNWKCNDWSDINKSLEREVIDMTRKYKDDIKRTCEHNKEYGSEW